MKLKYKFFFFFNILKIDVDLFLFKAFFKNLISKLSSFDSFSTINLKKRILITNEIINRSKKFFNNDILLLSYLYRLKINNILFFNIVKTILSLFIYNFSKIRSYYLY